MGVGCLQGVMAVSTVMWDMAGPGGLGCLVSRFTPVHTPWYEDRF